MAAAGACSAGTPRSSCPTSPSSGAERRLRSLHTGGISSPTSGSWPIGASPSRGRRRRVVEDYLAYLAASGRARARRRAPSRRSAACTASVSTSAGRHRSDRGLSAPRIPQADPEGTERGRGRAAARRPSSATTRGAARPGDPRAPLRDRHAHLGAGGAAPRRPRLRTRDGPRLREGLERAPRARRAPRPARRSRRGSARAGGRRWRRPLGAPRRRGGAVHLDPGPADVTPDRLGRRAQRRGEGPPRGPGDAARAAPLLRHPSARARRRHPSRAGAARPRRHHDDAGLHEGLARAARRVYERRIPSARTPGDWPTRAPAWSSP